METNMLKYDFMTEIAKTINAREARCLLLTGNILDLFYVPDEKQGDYLPLLDFLIASWKKIESKVLVTYELNGPIRFINENDREEMKSAWISWRTNFDKNQIDIQPMIDNKKLKALSEKYGADFEKKLKEAIGKPTEALEILRQLCLCSRSLINGKKILEKDLLIIIERTDQILPEGEISRLSDTDRHRLGIYCDWFADPRFINGNDAVILIAENRSSVNQQVAKLPSIAEVEVPFPDETAREYYVNWFKQTDSQGGQLKLWGTVSDFASASAGLSIYSLRKLIVRASYEQKQIEPAGVVAQVEQHIKIQLGEDVVEFKKPHHKLNDLIGFNKLKVFLRAELIPRLRSTGPDSLSGAAVSGPLGSGKTFIFEAVAAELNIPVLVLKNIRSKWYGETDVIFERLYRVIEALSRVLIFVDEADTQFGGVGADSHETERRLTGKIQAMMSDPRLKGKVSWLLMTARIHLLSPDIRRPGRVGDLIIPVLDPEGEDRIEFIKWMIEPALGKDASEDVINQIDQLTKGYSAASFTSLRSEIMAKKTANKEMNDAGVIEIIRVRIPPAIDQTRKYQNLQALLNCTRRDLLPDPNVDIREKRAEWQKEINQMELQGIK